MKSPIDEDKAVILRLPQPLNLGHPISSTVLNLRKISDMPDPPI